MKTKINTKHYDSIRETSRYFLANNGCEYYISEIPNIYQRIDDRKYKIEKTSDSNGEPTMDGEIKHLTAEELFNFGQKFNI